VLSIYTLQVNATSLRLEWGHVTDSTNIGPKPGCLGPGLNHLALINRKGLGNNTRGKPIASRKGRYLTQGQGRGGLIVAAEVAEILTANW